MDTCTSVSSPLVIFSGEDRLCIFTFDAAGESSLSLLPQAESTSKAIADEMDVNVRASFNFVS
ncbi:MAG: hypothetical protein LBE78_13565 [Burkholderiaceae bacterium]|nr:hypothetical protein [Burkholderiaceae bacterium]